ncbi:putative repeat protein (TIGR03943 family) [Leucobacter luti]|uniref:Putative repeat protein (TIGR03943 family) n=2 Tax=Leucobacter luti TaxID=340320 RepID=A0A4R6RX30_9MICO|nr:putative repeat protein (TIGR03943 family) [Leucobacter luti]
MALTLFGCGLALILSLAVTGRLGWYIHPRSVSFSTIMATLGCLGVVCAVGVQRAHRRESPSRVRQARSRWSVRVLKTLAPTCFTAVGVAALLILPPVTLTTERAAERVLAPSEGAGFGSAAADGEAARIAGSADAERTLREWAVLARQPEASSVLGRTATLTGFVVADEESPDQVFLVARYVITCCAVDAQPVGVPVYVDGWHAQVAAGDWVELTGVFTTNPDIGGRWAAVVIPDRIVKVEVPEEPYVVE